MPAPLKRYKRDPNGLNRGAGLYYRRGKTSEYPKGYYSKYSVTRDAKVKSEGYKLDNVGMPKLSKLLHTMDGNIYRR